MTRKEISAGCVVYRMVDRRVDVALIQPIGRNAWALPKGLVEEGESIDKSAAREAREETGLTGVVGSRLGTIRYKYRAVWLTPPIEVFKVVTFFLMECTGGDISKHDTEVQSVAWFGIDDAIRRASYRLERDILKTARKRIAEELSA